ncbi:diguanylate cyclase (GGDEF) domain-containing protein [Paenibacillus catalpae]|uniref:Diguanylate cyclase (GGDEF) domain-containing protein n=1 Tax=Paenibacillus catalpae TaxID=1045775 RepID=A0A1I1YEM8_9BACL|nr:GGDEF domain-containing protein [Paenibacillus catalpae]SFE17991.1 diguanylate cyclase (GGDEF) domain-containing protein [Paenibacillus catalpae]
MPSNIRSLDDAAGHVLQLLTRFFHVDTLFIAIKEGSGHRIVQAYNRKDVIVQSGMTYRTDVSTIIGQRSTYFVPISASDHLIHGAIYLVDRDRLSLSGDDVTVLNSMAALLGYTIDLEYATVTDSLTGLYNRRFLDELFQRHTDAPLGVIFIDLNEFKQINDNYGHDFGDLLLIEIAKRLKQQIRQSDRIIRYGGDEFIICFQNLNEENGVRAVYDKISASFLDPFIINGQPVFISPSIGVSSNQGRYASLKQLIMDADQAMYQMKQTRKKP